MLTGPPDENELVAAQLKRLDTAIEAKERERARLLDAYQAGLLELEELTRRTGVLAARRAELTQEKETLSRRSAELAAQNRMRRRLAGFSDRVAASLDGLDFAGRRRLVRLVVEKVCVTGWRVEIHLKIPLPNEPPPDEDRPDHRPSGPDPTPAPPRPKPPSSDVRLRSDHRAAARGHRATHDPTPAGALAPLHDRVGSSRGAVPGVTAGPFPRPALRNRYVEFHVTGCMSGGWLC